MAVTAELDQSSDELTISVKGRFDFSAHQDFREAYERVNGKPKRYVVDLKDATYLDSSALGMLLLMRDHAGGDHSHIEVTNCNADVRKILAISNFEKLMKIS